MTGCPLNEPELREFAKLPNPARTKEIIGFLREKAGLPPLKPEQLNLLDIDDKDTSPKALKGVPSPFNFQLTSRGTISIAENSANWPVLPQPSSAKDHEQRLEACKMVATDLIEELQRGAYQARREYLASLQKYEARLPSGSNEGNILLADAAARTLRNLFAAEVDILSPAFSSALKTFLEQHIGLRTFYPEIASFYSDVQDGRLSAPLPIDAVDGFVKGVQQYTPTVFEPDVIEALDETGEIPVSISQAGAGSAEGTASISPPPDPLGEVEPKKARDVAVAGVINKLWEVFTSSEKLNKSIEAWIKASQTLGPYAKTVLRWLETFLQSGNHHP